MGELEADVVEHSSASGRGGVKKGRVTLGAFRSTTVTVVSCSRVKVNLGSEKPHVDTMKASV